jgi:protein tyrosine phosphatase
VVAVIAIYILIRFRRRKPPPLLVATAPRVEPQINVPPPPISISVVPTVQQPGKDLHLNLSPQPSPPQHIRIKTKGLLERRGSNASLTIELNPLDGVPCGTPPKECSNEEYLSSVGNPMTRKQLRHACKNRKALQEEFSELPDNHGGKLDVAGASNKNRYKSIWPNDVTRVHLAPINNSSTYIHANYIRGYDGEAKSFIATQGPLPNTINDFWRMVFEQRSPCIVMITKLRERNKIKCEPYLPDHDGLFGNIHVTCRAKTQKHGYEVRDLILRKISASGSASPNTSEGGVTSPPLPQQVPIAEHSPSPHVTLASNGAASHYSSAQYHQSPVSVAPPAQVPAACVGERRRSSSSSLSVQAPFPGPSRSSTIKGLQVKHYWYTSWPDHRVPSTPKQLLELIQECESERNRRKQLTNGGEVGPVTVHCSAGVGRTGCYIGISIGMRQLEEQNTVDVLGAICQMRLDRGGMVQSLEQYEFVHQALSQYEKTLPETPGSASYLPHHHSASIGSNSSVKSQSNSSHDSYKNSSPFW